VEADSKAAWSGMMARARGEKVLDDVTRIKKALRNDEKVRSLTLTHGHSVALPPS